MERRLENFCEPMRLWLAWEPPLDYSDDRMRWVVGELTTQEDREQFRYFDSAELKRLNDGKDWEVLKSRGFTGYPAFRLKEGGDTFDENVISAFRRRLPPDNRPDLKEYLAQFGLVDDEKLPVMALLAITQARLPSDGFSLIDPLDSNATSCDAIVEIVGMRHWLPFATALRPGEEVELRAEPDNPKDENAVAFYAHENKVGYVNRLQAKTVRDWLSARHVEARVTRKNGTSERPRAYVLLKVRPK